MGWRGWLDGYNRVVSPVLYALYSTLCNQSTVVLPYFPGNGNRNFDCELVRDIYNGHDSGKMILYSFGIGIPDTMLSNSSSLSPLSHISESVKRRLPV